MVTESLVAGLSAGALAGFGLGLAARCLRCWWRSWLAERKPFAVEVGHAPGCVRLEFSRPVRWAVFSPEAGRVLGVALKRAALAAAMEAGA